MNYTIIRTTSDDKLFADLVKALDQELTLINGDQNDFFAQFNKIDAIKHAAVILLEDKRVACGAIKAFDEQSMEVKRMFTHPNYRNKGLASILLQELESWTKELGLQYCVLETSIRQPDAIALYLKNQYLRIENYGHTLMFPKVYASKRKSKNIKSSSNSWFFLKI